MCKPRINPAYSVWSALCLANNCLAPRRQWVNVCSEQHKQSCLNFAAGASAYSVITAFRSIIFMKGAYMLNIWCYMLWSWTEIVGTLYLQIEAETKWMPFSRWHFKCIIMNEKFCIFIWISLEFVPKGPIHNKSTLVWVMAWRQIGDKPLPEPMLILFTGAFGTRGRWVNSVANTPIYPICSIFLPCKVWISDFEWT